MTIHGKDSDFIFIPYMVLLIDDHMDMYFFDADQKLHVENCCKNIMSLINKYHLTGVEKYDGRNDSFIVRISVSMNEHERAALIHSKNNMYLRDYTFKMVYNKAKNHEKYGTFSKPVTKPKWEPTNKTGFDIDRFLTKIYEPIIERETDNLIPNTFDFVRLRIDVMAYVPNQYDLILQHKDEILEKAVDKISNSRSYKKYGVPVNWLSLKEFVYMSDVHEIGLLFELKSYRKGEINNEK